MNNSKAAKARTAMLLAGAALITMIAAGQAEAQKRSFNLPPQNGRISIPEFARQAGIQISAPTEQLKPVRTRGVHGVLDAREALNRLLEGTGLVVASDTGAMIVLRKTTPPSGSTIGLLRSSESQTATATIQTAAYQPDQDRDRKSTRLNSSHIQKSRMPSSA